MIIKESGLKARIHKIVEQEGLVNSDISA
jgi:hypothetical protein